MKWKPNIRFENMITLRAGIGCVKACPALNYTGAFTLSLGVVFHNFFKSIVYIYLGPCFHAMVSLLFPKYPLNHTCKASLSLLCLTWADVLFNNSSTKKCSTWPLIPVLPLGLCRSLSPSGSASGHLIRQLTQLTLKS